VKQQGFGGRDKMAAINRFGMKSTPLLFHVDTVFSSLSSPSPSPPHLALAPRRWRDLILHENKARLRDCYFMKKEAEWHGHCNEKKNASSNSSHKVVRTKRALLSKYLSIKGH
jgi:hypothetical protein